MVSMVDMAIQEARNRNYPLGVHKSPKKAKGGFGRYTAHSGLSKNLSKDRMITFYKKGESPKEKMIDSVKIYSLIHFTFKGKERAGILLKYNKDTFTVQIVNENTRKAVRYDKFIKATDQIIIPLPKKENINPSGKVRNQDAKEKFVAGNKVGKKVSFMFKGKVTYGVVKKINDCTFTVSIDGLDKKKAIRFDKFLAEV